MAVRLTAGWTTLFLITLAAFFFLKIGDQVSRVWLAAASMPAASARCWRSGSVVTLGVRALTRMGRLERRTAIVGGGEAGEALIRALEMQRDTGLRVCGVFDDRNDDRSPDLVAGYPKLGTIDDLVEFARRTKLDLVIFTLPISAEARLLDHAAQALGAADRHPPLGAYVEAALPAALLFLYRRGAGARRLRPADRRLGHRRQVRCSTRSSARWP